MVLKIGEKVHIMSRRAFIGDLRRHFVGKIMEVGDTTIRVEGYSFIFHEGTSEYYRKPEIRTIIFSITDGRTVINVISPLTKIENVTYRVTADDILVATDGEHFRLDINEFGIHR